MKTSSPSMHWSVAHYRHAIGSFHATQKCSNKIKNTCACSLMNVSALSKNADNCKEPSLPAFDEMKDACNADFLQRVRSTPYVVESRCHLFASLYMLLMILLQLHKSYSKNSGPIHNPFHLKVPSHDCFTSHLSRKLKKVFYCTIAGIILLVAEQMAFTNYTVTILILSNDIELNPGPLNVPTITNVVQGTFHQGHETFSDYSIGKQCITNCASALAFSKVLYASQWTPQDLDNILFTGDTLFTEVKTKIDKRCKEIGIDSPHFLGIDELPKLQTLFNEHFRIKQLKILSAYVNTSNTSHSDNSIYYKHMMVQLKISTGAIFLIQHYACCAFYQDRKYYFFDSHSRNNYGMPSPNGSSVLLEFHDLSQFEQFIFQYVSYFNQDEFIATFMNMKILTGTAMSLAAQRIRFTNSNALPDTKCEKHKKSVSQSILIVQHMLL